MSFDALDISLSLPHDDDRGIGSTALQGTIVAVKILRRNLQATYFNGHSASTSDSKFGKTLPNRQISFHSDTGFPVKCNFFTPSWASVFLYVEHVESPVEKSSF